MHWGHARTKDFIRWEYLPAALAPDTPYDEHGCFSGSAVEMPDGKQLLMYTGVYQVRRPDGVQEIVQSQCLAVGDGTDYEKYSGNPVLDTSDLPDGASDIDFRDPKIWRDGDTYYAVMSSRSADSSGYILLYESADGFHWKYDGVIDSCENLYGKMWECPDFFPLDGKQVLLVSPMEMIPIGLEFHAGHGTVALIGSYDRESHKFQREQVQAIDYGIDFYATQTMETPDGRRIMIAWMQNWATTSCQGQGIRLFGSMTLPRELTIRNGRLIQNPVRELNDYHKNGIHHHNLVIDRECNLVGVKGRVLDMTVKVRPSGNKMYDWFKLTVAKDGEHGAYICYHPDSSIVRIDRTRCGGRFDIVHYREFQVTPREGEIKLRVVMDGNSVELFVNDGEQAATFLLYDPQEADSISFEAQGSVILDVDKYDLAL
jgi:beta-fructofuranosidase